MYKGADKVSKQVYDNHLLIWLCLKKEKKKKKNFSM